MVADLARVRRGAVDLAAEPAAAAAAGALGADHPVAALAADPAAVLVVAHPAAAVPAGSSDARKGTRSLTRAGTADMRCGCDGMPYESLSLCCRVTDLTELLSGAKEAFFAEKE